jgi:prepilin-type N-terminal cleavage/methylation domain-containing protein
MNIPIRHIAHGFTIIELAVVIFIVGILTAITAVYYNGARVEADNNTVVQDMAAFSRAAIKYKADTGAYAATGTALAAKTPVSFNTKLLMSTGTQANLVYCIGSASGAYALTALTNSGKQYYVTNAEQVKEYTGSVNWKTSSAATICSSVLTGSNVAGSAGWSLGVWQSWVTAR